MLVMKPHCEHCAAPLPLNSTMAMICSYECTYCIECSREIFRNKCPNCGGDLEKRPGRIDSVSGCAVPDIKRHPYSAPLK